MRVCVSQTQSSHHSHFIFRSQKTHLLHYKLPPMEYYNSLKLKDNRYPLIITRPGETQNSSTFSSTLLDAIYRSIDEIDGAGEQEDMVVYRETKKQSITGFEYHDEDIARHRRVCLIEKLMEKKKVTQSRRRSVPDFDRNPWGIGLTHSSSSSSDSSSGGGFSSSEADSIYGAKPKPVISSVFWGKTEEIKKQRKSNKTHDHNHNQDKKSKKATKNNQPMSPGGRLTSFLNSLFTTNNIKKSKSDMIMTSTESKSTCSSASSFSRSCLSTGSKTAKRSVRFNVDDDYQPYSRQKSLNIPIPTKNPNIKHEVMKIQIQEKKYDHKMSHEVDDYDDDDASCASSDLFELDNLSVIGIDRYCEELPVYETTHVHTNRAIANGLIP